MRGRRSRAIRNHGGNAPIPPSLGYENGIAREEGTCGWQRMCEHALADKPAESVACGTSRLRIPSIRMHRRGKKRQIAHSHHSGIAISALSISKLETRNGPCGGVGVFHTRKIAPKALLLSGGRWLFGCLRSFAGVSHPHGAAHGIRRQRVRR